MNCKQARRAMQDVLDSTQADHPELDAHCAECPQCCAEWRQLQAIDSAVRADTQCDVPVECRDRVIAAALRRIELQQRPAVRAVRWVRGVATAALLIAVLVSGLYAGRALWPREVIVPQIVKVPEVREKIVEVEVPVVQEKVVVKRVPVYKTIIVYREREVEKPVPVVAATANPEPVKLDEVIVLVASNPVPPAVQVREETKPTTVIGEAESRGASPIEGHRQQSDSTITEAAAEMVIAQNMAD